MIKKLLTTGLGLEGGYNSILPDSNDLTEGLKADMDSAGSYAAIVWDF